MTDNTMGLIVSYIDTLIADPNATPPPGLDSADVAFVRQMVEARRVSPLGQAQRERLWRRTLAEAAAQRHAWRQEHANGHRPEETKKMVTVARKPMRLSYWTAAAALAVLVLVVGLMSQMREQNIPTEKDGKSDPRPAATPGSIGGSPIREFALEHESPVVNAVISPDGSRLASWAENGSIIVWNTQDGMPLVTLDTAGVGVLGLVWSPDNALLFGGLANGEARLWDVTTGDMLFTHKNASIQDGFWSPDGHRVFAVIDSSLQVWDVASQTPLFVLPLENIYGGAIFSPDSMCILVWFTDGTLEVIDAAIGDVISRTHFETPVSGGTWAADGTRTLIWSEEGSIFWWEPETGTRIDIDYYKGSIGGVIVSPDTTWIALWDRESEIVRVYDAATSQVTALLKHEKAVNGALVDGPYLLTWSDDGTIRVWDTAPGTQLAVLNHGKMRIDNAAWGIRNSDNYQVITWWAGDQASARVWQLTVIP